MKFRFSMWWSLALLILLIASPPAFAATYTYDDLNRLTMAAYAEGTYVEYTYDAAGNLLSVTPSDTVAPTTTLACDGQEGRSGWYISDVVITLAAEDDEGGSGVKDTTYSLGGGTWHIYSAPFSISTEGTTTVYFYSTDNAANQEEIKRFTLKIDKTPPQLQIDVPHGTYLLNESILVCFDATDALSGIATTTATTSNGEPLATSSIGEKEFILSAEDNAGNSATETITYAVIYGFSGILPPIKGEGTSIFKLGSTVPVKFELTDAHDTPIATAEARLYLAKVENGALTEEQSAISTAKATAENLFRYDTGDGHYIFNLATRGLSSGTFRLRVALDDGESKYVDIALR